MLGGIGVRRMGGALIRRGFARFDDVRIAAVADADLRVAEAIAKPRPEDERLVSDRWLVSSEPPDLRNVTLYQDYRELLDREDIDAVVIATPEHWHALPCIHAAQAGKNIYCEKPLARTIREGQRIVEAVRKYHRVFQTGTRRRSAEEWYTACMLVRNGRLGKLIRVVDFLDMVQWGLGTDRGGPVEVWTVGEPFDSKTRRAPQVFMRYPGDVTLECTAGSSPPRFFGENGMLTVQGTSVVSDPPELAKEPLVNPEVKLYRSTNHYQDWLECIKQRRQPVADVEVGHRSVTVAHLGNIARWVSERTGQTGQRLQGDPQAERFTNSDIANEFLERPCREPYQLPTAYLQAHGQFALFALTRYEVIRGLKDANATTQLARFATFCQNSLIHPITDAILERAADLWVMARRAGHPRSDADIIIAATAIEHGLVLLTGNTQHFAWAPDLTLANWRVSKSVPRHYSIDHTLPPFAQSGQLAGMQDVPRITHAR